MFNHLTQAAPMLSPTKYCTYQRSFKTHRIQSETNSNTSADIPRHNHPHGQTKCNNKCSRKRCSNSHLHGPNPCPDCNIYKQCKIHPNNDKDCCFWNNKHNGYHAKWICNKWKSSTNPSTNSQLTWEATTSRAIPMENDRVCQQSVSTIMTITKKNRRINLNNKTCPKLPF